MKVAAAMLPVPATQLPPTQIAAPDGNLAEPNGIAAGIQERGRGHELIQHTDARTDHRLLVAEDIPCETRPRRPIAVIGIVGRSDPVANLHKAGRGVGIEIAQPVVGIRPNRAQFIAHADVDREPRGRPEVVLEESGEVIRVDISNRVAHEDRGIP